MEQGKIKKITSGSIIFLLLFFNIFSLGGLVVAGAQNDDNLPYVNEIQDTGLIPCDGITVECGICQIFQLISNIINFAVFYIAAPLGALMLIYGGIMMAASPANEQGIKKGKSAFGAAVWGLVITFAAWIIVNVILGALADKPFSESWYQFPGCESYGEGVHG